MNSAQLSRPIDVSVIWRRGWIVVVCAIVGAGVSFLHVNGEKRQYSAVAGLLFGSSSVGQALGLSTPAGATGAQATNQDLVGLPVISQLTTTALGSMTPPGGFTVHPYSSGASNIVDVRATTHSAVSAAMVANAYADQFIRYETSAQTRQVQAAIRAIRTQLRAQPRSRTTTQQVVTLQKTLGQLQTVLASKPVNVNVAQRATPPDHSSGPSRARETVLGLLIGAVIGLIFAILMEMLDPRLHSVKTVTSSDLEVFTVGGDQADSADLRRVAVRLVRRMGRGRPRDGDPDQACVLGLLLSGPGRPDTDLRASVARMTGLVSAEAGFDTAVLRLAGGAPEETAQTLPDGLVEVSELVSLLRRQTATGTTGCLDVFGATARLLADDGGESARLFTTLRATYRRLVVHLSPADFSPPSIDALMGEAEVTAIVARLHRADRRAVAKQIDQARVSGYGSPILVAVDRRLSPETAEPAADLARDGDQGTTIGRTSA